MRIGDRNKLGSVLVLGVSLAAGAVRGQEAGDPAGGAEVFKQQCAACHAVGPGAKATAAGPGLNGLIGRRAGGDKEFPYSPQNRTARITWDNPTLTRFLKAPKSLIPGTKMLFNGLSTPKEIADVVAYLAQFDDAGAKKP